MVRWTSNRYIDSQWHRVVQQMYLFLVQLVRVVSPFQALGFLLPSTFPTFLHFLLDFQKTYWTCSINYSYWYLLVSSNQPWILTSVKTSSMPLWSCWTSSFRFWCCTSSSCPSLILSFVSSKFCALSWTHSLWLAPSIDYLHNVFRLSWICFQFLLWLLWSSHCYYCC